MVSEFLFGTSQPGKRDYLFKISVWPRQYSSGTTQKNIYHLHPNRNFRVFMVNGKRQIKTASRWLCPNSQLEIKPCSNTLPKSIELLRTMREWAILYVLIILIVWSWWVYKFFRLVSQFVPAIHYWRQCFLTANILSSRENLISGRTKPGWQTCDHQKECIIAG